MLFSLDLTLSVGMVLKEVLPFRVILAICDVEGHRESVPGVFTKSSVVSGHVPKQCFLVAQMKVVFKSVVNS